MNKNCHETKTNVSILNREHYEDMCRTKAILRISYYCTIKGDIEYYVHIYTCIHVLFKF